VLRGKARCPSAQKSSPVLPKLFIASVVPRMSKNLHEPRDHRSTLVIIGRQRGCRATQAVGDQWCWRRYHDCNLLSASAFSKFCVDNDVMCTDLLHRPLDARWARARHELGIHASYAPWICVSKAKAVLNASLPSVGTFLFSLQ